MGQPAAETRWLLTLLVRELVLELVPNVRGRAGIWQYDRRGTVVRKRGKSDYSVLEGTAGDGRRRLVAADATRAPLEPHACQDLSGILAQAAAGREQRPRRESARRAFNDSTGNVPRPRPSISCDPQPRSGGAFSMTATGSMTSTRRSSSLRHPYSRRSVSVTLARRADAEHLPGFPIRR